MLNNVTPQAEGKILFNTSNDFPPVALLVSEFEKRELVTFGAAQFITDMAKFFGDNGGTNTDPFLLETVVREVENSGVFSSFNQLLSLPDGVDATTAVMFLQNKFSVPAEFFNHCSRFGMDLGESLRWGTVIGEAAQRDLTIEDAYYATAISDKLNQTAYRMFMKNPSTRDTLGRIRYEAILSYIDLKNMLRSEGEKFAGYHVFCVADAFSIEQIKTLLIKGHSLEDIVVYNSMGLSSVEDILEYGKTLPKEWVDIVRDEEL